MEPSGHLDSGKKIAMVVGTLTEYPTNPQFVYLKRKYRAYSIFFASLNLIHVDGLLSDFIDSRELCSLLLVISWI